MFVLIASGEWEELKKSIASLGDKIDYLHRMVSRNFLIVEQKEDQIMSELTDAVAKVSTDLDSLGTSLDNDSTAIQGAIAALQKTNPDVGAAVTALQALDGRLQGYSTTIDTNTAALNTAVTPPSPPSPPSPPAPQAGRK